MKRKFVRATGLVVQSPVIAPTTWPFTTTTCDAGPDVQPQTAAGTQFEPHPVVPVESILQEAQRIIHGPRRVSYGHPKKNFADTAAMWSVLLGVTVTPRQVAQCMIALKLCRDGKKANRDNLVDIAGYAGTAELLDEAA